MTKRLKMLSIPGLLTGCAAVPALPLLSGIIPAPASGGTQILTATKVNLSGQNFKIISQRDWQQYRF